MKNFQIEMINAAGQVCWGFVEAVDAAEARAQAEKAGYKVREITEL